MPGPQAKQRASGIRLGLVRQRSPRTLPEGRSARRGQRCFRSALTEDNAARLTSNDSSGNTGSNGTDWPTSSSDPPNEEPSVLEPSSSQSSYVTWETLSSWFRQTLLLETSPGAFSLETTSTNASVSGRGFCLACRVPIESGNIDMQAARHGYKMT